MADIGGLFTAAAGGGLFGIIGQVANRAFGVWEAREKRKDTLLGYAQEEKRWGHEKVLLEIQMKQAHEAHEQDLERLDVAGSWQGLGESMRAEAALPSSYGWVNAVRSLTRPFLTLESQIALLIVFFTAQGVVRAEIQATIVETVTFIATASALWWFGERAERKTKGR